MKFRILFCLIFLYFFSILKAYAIPRCEEFYQAVYNDPIREDVNRTYYNDNKDLGIRLKTNYNIDTKNTVVTFSEKKSLFVGKITQKKLLNKIEVGDEIIAINGEYLKDIEFDEREKELLVDNVSKLYDFDEEVEITILKNNEEVSFKLTNKRADYNAPVIDLFVNSLEIDDKNGFFLASIETDFYENLTNNYDLSKFFWDTAVYNKKYSNEKLYNYSFERCYFTENEWHKLNTVDPSFGISFGNLIEEQKQVRVSEYEIVPKEELYFYNEEAGINYNQDELSNLSDEELTKIYENGSENFFFKENNIELTNNSSSVYKIKNNFNLISFPFDKQVLRIYLYDNKHKLDDHKLFYSYWSEIKANEFKNNNDIQGWRINDIDFYFKPFHSALTNNVSDGFVMKIEIERKYMYYIFKIILPIVLILVICWSSVWIHPKEIESRLTITIVCLLSLIAYNFVIDSDLPKLEYLTVMDYIILISYFYATIPNFLTILSFNLLKNRNKNKQNFARRIEYLEARYGLLSYLLIILTIIIVASNLNPDHSSQALTWASAK